MNKKSKLVFGVGINDADYVVQPVVNGKQMMCPYYMAWTHMLERCYSAKYLAKHPTYIGCYVCNDWLTFSKFKAWMETQSWVDKQPDKDLLLEGNKVYSPTTCVFVDRITNTFITDRGAARGEWPIGVDFPSTEGKFRARCSNPFTRKVEHLGYFICPSQAHKAWQAKKHEYACQLADLQEDPRVADALRQRYAPNKDWTSI